MNDEEIDNFLAPSYDEQEGKSSDEYMRHFLEQYRIYMLVFNGTVERRQRANEFFLGLNTALMAFLGYIEAKEGVPVPYAPIIFTLVPLIGVALCYSWYCIICSFKQLSRAKFKVIHRLERKLPAKLFETEWELLGKGKDYKKYHPLSHIEKNIPIIFIVLYLIIFFANIPAGFISGIFH